MAGPRTHSSTPPSGPIDIGSRLELFVDDALVSTLEGVDRRLHRPTPEEVVLEHDDPWEGIYPLYHTVFEDDDRYRMFYRGWNGPEWLRDDESEEFFCLCYAESEDGVEWDKPDLGRVEFDGSTANNILLTGEVCHAFVPFKDPTADPESPATYKAIGRGEDADDENALYAFESPDGFDWSKVAEEPIFTYDQGDFDSQNLAFWDPHREEYRCYFRYRNRDAPSGPRRDVKTATSSDFRQWSDPEPLEYVEGQPPHQLYTNVVKPYYRAPHVLLGFPARYVERDVDAESLRELPGWEPFRREYVAENSRTGYGLTDTLLMSSRDGEAFEVWPRTFLPPGLWNDDTTLNWKYGDNYCAWQLVETPSPEAGKPCELSLYASEGYRTDLPRLRRYSLRIDGFVSVSADFDGGELLTKPLVFEGEALLVNFATSAGGSIRVELQDAGGGPIDGFGLAECEELFGDDLERRVTWAGSGDVSALAGEPVRLRVAMTDADLYSFRFR